MIFTKEHIGMIRSGEKTVTRRIWKTPHVKVGGIYGIRSDRFKPVPEDAPRIRVTSVMVERLRDITVGDVKKEGYTSISKFMEIWGELHDGFWNPNQKVYRIEFELVGDAR
ncbi:MAG: ASCH domain-containing protein [Candidatus Thermoplasmatota archaeon]|nr:ASCH domain-containing protein [Candidatus Thermoplasmatota archaeon]